MSNPRWGRYTDLHPDALADMLSHTPIAVVPWGALEWHGAHLPLGMDGIAAQYVADHVVQRTGGVLLPMTWWPMTTLPPSLFVGSQNQHVCGHGARHAR